MVRLALALALVTGTASTTVAQTAALPLSADEAQVLSKDALAEMMFGAAADEVVAARADPLYMSDMLAGATFLLKPRPAVDGHIVFYEGACAIRRVHVTLDMADDGRRVEDVETDTTWAVLGPMSVISPDMDIQMAPGERDPKELAREAACDALSDFHNLVESPDANTLMLGTDALAALLSGSVGVVTCDDDTACGDVHWEALRTARLTRVDPCDDYELNESLGIREDQTCVALEFRVPGGGILEYDIVRVTAAGDTTYGQRFVPTRALIGMGTVIVD